MKNFKFKPIVMMFALVFMVFGGLMTHTTTKADSGADFNQTGTITEINPTLGVVTVLGTNGITYHVPVSPEKITTLAIGASIEIHGSVSSDGTLTFSKDDSISLDVESEEEDSALETDDDLCEQIAQNLITNGATDSDTIEKLACDFGLDAAAISDLIQKAELNSIDPIFLALAVKAGLADALMADLAAVDPAEPIAVSAILYQYQQQIKATLGSDFIEGVIDEDSDYFYFENSDEEDLYDSEDDVEMDDESELEDSMDDESELEDSMDDESELEDSADDQSELED